MNAYDFGEIFGRLLLIGFVIIGGLAGVRWILRSRGSKSN
jgi:hypothetical protein